jgi:amino acid transporter
MAKSNKFGTFGGVFTPSILTILGVIMYLRLPMIIGEAGLWATIGIIIVAHIISVTTGLSVSSIATDKKVEAGGTYFMISRSLGLPIGGTLGLALFVGLSFSVSLYLIGFSESFLGFWGLDTGINNIRLTGTLVLLAVTTLTFISTSLAMKTQYFIMAAIVLSLISVFFGSHEYTPSLPVISGSSSAVPLMVLFGIFFPAVTGFEAGVSMSGDLKDAKKSIPSGSIMAIVVGLVVYIILTFFLSYTVDANALASDANILLKIAWVPELVIAGVWGATLSSALGSILGAPRILQATAVDKISPKFFAKGYGPSSEPRNALLLTFLIAEGGILIGDLDVIARVVSIFFITTYGFLNLSAAFESWTGADFRPEFKVSGWISLIGALACMIVMIQLDFVAMLGAVLILGLLFLYLKRKELTLESGDAWSGVWASLVRKGLSSLKHEKLHNRNWRPNIILFSGKTEERQHLVEISRAITGKLGILSAFELIETQEQNLKRNQSNLTGEETGTYFQHQFYCRNIYDGMDEISRVYGFSGVEPNTILMGWSKNKNNKDRFIDLLSRFDSYQFNTIFLGYNTTKKYGNHRTIDIWWGGEGKNLAFAINLIRHINNSHLWKQAKVRLLIINNKNSDEEEIYKKATSIFDDYRVEGEIKIVNNELDKIAEKDIISNESKDTDLVILEIPEQKYNNLGKYYNELTEIAVEVGTVLIINASDDFENLEVISTKVKGRGKSLLDEADEKSLELPPLSLSKHPEIAADILKIDENGQKVLELFHHKIFEPLINDHINVLSQLGAEVKYVQKQLNKISEFPDTYRKKRACDKLKNEIFFKINALFTDELQKNLLPNQLVKLSEGISWYESKLLEDFKQFPRNLVVEFPKEDFSVHPEDRFSMKAYKRLKKLKLWFAGQSISHSINYREVARFYQLNNRQVFLSQLLTRFEEEEIAFYNDLRHVTNNIIADLDETERKIWQESLIWNDQSKYDETAELIQKELINQKELSKLYKGRLLLEFRKNLQLMSNDLGKIDVDRIIQKKSRSAKYYKALVTKINNFSEDYHPKIKTLLNKILMELSVNATKNRMEAFHIEFGEKLDQVVTQKYLKYLDAVADKIKKEGNKVDLQKLKFDEDFEVELEEAFNENRERMMELTENMPETLEVYSAKGKDNESQETLSVPIARMAEYFLKSRYEVMVEEQFRDVLEALKKSLFSTGDLFNLALFNLENLPTEREGVAKNEILEDCLTKIELEKAAVNKKIEEYLAFADGQFEKAFEPLSSMKIEESADDFITGLRSYQGKRVWYKISHLTQDVGKFFQGLVTELFYRRSEGILLAKKLKSTPGLNSSISSLLNLRDKVNFSAERLKSLPPYYIALFNGKSNIGKDFWIPRPEEEQQFSKAVERHREGFCGGILLLGERNSGKTAFGKYALEKHVKSKDTYSVFPPLSGTITKEGFTLALRKATQINEEAGQIMGLLPTGSIIIINDLELFWERAEKGLTVIHMLEQLIDEYGQRILFVVNMNPHAYKLINQLTGFGNRFVEIINFTPFDAKDLKELMMKRHRSSGFGISFNDDKTNLNELQLAQLFNGYFDYSEGNPGVALNGWLSNIKKVSGNNLIINKPDYPSITSLKELDENWTMLLMQFVLHKRLTQDKIQRITGWDTADAKGLILAMFRSGIIVEKSSGVYIVDPFIHPFLIKALKDKELLR